MRRVLGQDLLFCSPWCDLTAKRVSGDPRPHYSLRLPDYVSVLATTRDARVLLVRQYRPAVERTTLELPSGHVDPGETPGKAARRELREETGYVAGKLIFLGRLEPDTGRLGNRMWCFFAPSSPRAPRTGPESGIAVVRVTPAHLRRKIIDGSFSHALHIATITLAHLHGHFSMEPV